MRRRRKMRLKRRGLGDAVAAAAHPVAAFLDYALGTDFEHCEGCRKRRRFLNKMTLRANGKRKG